MIDLHMHTIYSDGTENCISILKKCEEKRLKELLSETEFLTKDIGSVLVGEETVKEGIINEVGGIKEALSKLHEMIRNYKQTTDKN